MNKEYLAVCGTEEIYINRMYQYVLSTYGNEFEVILFTREDYFKEFIKEVPVEVVIAEESFEVPESDNIRVKAILSEEPGNDERVYKYMPCDRILKEVMAMCAAGSSVKRMPVKAGEKTLIGVYTPVKRCFQTTFSLTLGQILAKSHKVLYLNFESFSGFETLCRANGKTDLMDLVYFSECMEENFSYRIDSIKEKIGNLDYISPVKAFVKYSEVSKEQWERLIDNLLSKTDYEYVILDLSEQVNGLLNILMKCSRIYTITDSGRLASAKVAQYENLLRSSAYEGILGKTENITIPKFKEIPADFEMLPYSELATYLKKEISFEGEIYDE